MEYKTKDGQVLEIPDTDEEMEDNLNIPRGAMGHMGDLTANLIAVAQEENLNALIVGGKPHKAHIVILLLRESDKGIGEGGKFIEYFPVTPGKEDRVFKDLSSQMVTLSRDWNAVTDVNLNTLGNPFFSKEKKAGVLSEEVGNGVVSFGQYTEQELAMMVAGMSGLLPSDIGDW